MRQSSSKYALAKRYLKAGKYHEAESFASQALSLAIEEGNVYMMIESSLLIGHCYASINNVPLMLENYGYAENLSRGVNPAKKKEIDYNIGAVFVSIKRYDEALPRLLNSIPDEENDLSVMICHKLAIVYFEKNNPIEGRKWLNKGYDALSRNPNGLYKKMLELVEMRSNPGYLDSDGYESLLLDVCKNVGILGYGFKIFHNKYLTEYYTHKRKYKEAYGIALEMIDFLE